MAVLGRGRAWQNYDVTSHGNGSATVRVQTVSRLGSEDSPERSELIFQFDTLEQALQHSGRSRISSSGVVVTVRVDGREYIG